MLRPLFVFVYFDKFGYDAVGNLDLLRYYFRDSHDTLNGLLSPKLK